MVGLSRCWQPSFASYDFVVLPALAPSLISVLQCSQPNKSTAVNGGASVWTRRWGDQHLSFKLFLGLTGMCCPSCCILACTQGCSRAQRQAHSYCQCWCRVLCCHGYQWSSICLGKSWFWTGNLLSAVVELDLNLPLILRVAPLPRIDFVPVLQL